MQAKTRYRLIGIVVVLALLFIFVPWIWQRSVLPRRVTVSMNVPSAPTPPTVTIKAPTPPAVADETINSFTIQAAAPPSSSLPASAPTTASVDKSTQLIKKPAVKAAVVVQKMPSTAQDAAEQKMAADVGAGTSQLPAAWVVQLGTFGDEANAQALITRLRRDGFDAYEREISQGAAKLTQIFVGPKINKADIQKMLSDLKKRYRLEGVVKPYRV